MPETVIVKVSDLEQIRKKLGLAKAELLYKLFVLNAALEHCHFVVRCDALPRRGTSLKTLAAKRGVPRYLTDALNTEKDEAPLEVGFTGCDPNDTSEDPPPSLSPEELIKELRRVLALVDGSRSKIGTLLK